MNNNLCRNLFKINGGGRVAVFSSHGWLTRSRNNLPLHRLGGSWGMENTFLNAPRARNHSRPSVHQVENNSHLFSLRNESELKVEEKY